MILTSVDSGTVNKYDEVSIPHGVANTVDCMPADTAKNSSIVFSCMVFTSVDGSTSNKYNGVSVQHGVVNTVDRMSVDTTQSSPHYSQDLLMASYNIISVTQGS